MIKHWETAHSTRLSASYLSCVCTCYYFKKKIWLATVESHLSNLAWNAFWVIMRGKWKQSGLFSVSCLNIRLRKLQWKKRSIWSLHKWVCSHSCNESSSWNKTISLITITYAAYNRESSFEIWWLKVMLSCMCFQVDTWRT